MWQVGPVEIVSYQDFGAAFVDELVTVARVEDAVAKVAGGDVEAGPIGVGPGDAATVMAKGSIGAPTAKPAAPGADGTRRFSVAIPVELHLTVKVAGSLHRFESSVVARLGLAVRTAANPLALQIDVEPPQVFDMEVEVRSTGIAAKVLGRLGNVDGKIRKEVVRFISEMIESDTAREATVIEIGSRVDEVWA